MREHPFQAEQAKTGAEQGKYVTPQAHGKSAPDSQKRGGLGPSRRLLPRWFKMRSTARYHRRRPEPRRAGGKTGRATTQILETEKLTPTIGAEVFNVDRDRLRDDEDLPQAVTDALEEHLVLVFRGLDIDDETQVAFCRKLGELVVFPKQQIPEIFVVTLDPEKNPMANYVEASTGWHFDDTVQEFPSKATMLSAKVIAAEGGETEFSSTYAAYDDLSDEEKARLASLRVFHSQEPFQRLIYSDPTEEQLAEWRGRSRVHPLVWTHASGRKSLVLSQTADYVVGMDLDEGRTLLADLIARATRRERVYQHIWSERDTIMWDNLGVVHRARPYAQASRRELHRSAVVGTEPIQ